MHYYRNHKDIDKDVLKQAKIFILAGPQSQFTEAECEHLKVISISNTELLYFNESYN